MHVAPRDPGALPRVLLLLAVAAALTVVLALAWAQPSASPLVIEAPSGAHIRLGSNEAGELELIGPGGKRTSRPRSAGYSPVLDAVRRGRAPLVVSVRGEATLEVGRISAQAIELEAHRIELRGELTGQTVNVHARERILVDAAGQIAAPAVELAARVLHNAGTLQADGAKGGRIDLRAEHFMNQGTISALGTSGTGGTVTVSYDRFYAESRHGALDVSGRTQGGEIHIDGHGRNSHLFTSGEHLARGGRGGRITLRGAEVKLVVARLDAGGERAGGAIDVGGKDQESETRQLLVRSGTRLDADAAQEGPGGRIVLASLDTTRFHGSASARGGLRGGDGGFVEISSAGDVGWHGDVDTSAAVGRPGKVLLDPKNITIGNAEARLFQFELLDPTPNPGDQFGAPVVALATGNVVVVDRGDDFAAIDAGAVHLYSGQDGALLGTLTGSTDNDRVGSAQGPSSLTPLASGHLVIRSQDWDNGSIADAGAVTFFDGDNGTVGEISTANSLVGSTAGDGLSTLVIPLSNGNYVVTSPTWDSGGAADAGAVTFGDGDVGIAGEVSAANSLVGSTASDRVGTSLTALTNGNYVVSSVLRNGGAGAITWGDGDVGTAGEVSATNSLVGSNASDALGSGGVTALSNGHYVVLSPEWNDGVTVGAATWGNGNGGTVGTLSASNSLLGLPSDFKGGTNPTVTALSNGHYVVLSPIGLQGVGAVTWCNGNGGTVGAVSAANSLVGSTGSDLLDSKVTALNNGHYVVGSPRWDDGATDVGAATWCNGNGGTVGAVSDGNSLIGSNSGSLVGSGVTALANGNYLVLSSSWDNEAIVDAGAATWCNGNGGTVGVVSAANSLVGSAPSDSVGADAVPLANGHYVVSSQSWDYAGTADVGAVTWGNGNGGTVGQVSATNSLVGSTANDQMGSWGVVPLGNGHYVIPTPNWDNGPLVNAGAVTWGNGNGGTDGQVSAGNSLVGSTANDRVGGSVTALNNGHYVVGTSAWDNGVASDVGAATWGNGNGGTLGEISAANSLVGSSQGDQIDAATALEDGHYMIIGSGWDNGGVENAGAVAWGSGSGGIAGEVSATNSVLGSGASSDATGTAGAAEGTFVASFPSAGSGHVYVGVVSLDEVAPGYAWREAESFTVPPHVIASTLERGLDVTLEASNDIVVDAELVVEPEDGAGNLTLAAGRSLTLNATVATGGGDLTLVANDFLVSGVVDGQREAGEGGIAWANAAEIDAGEGRVELHVLSGAGKTHSEAGPLAIGSISAGSVLALAEAGLNLEGVLSATDPADAVTLVANAAFVAAPTASLNAAKGRFLIYASSPSVADLGALTISFSEYGKPYPAPPEAENTGSGILYASDEQGESLGVSVEQAAGQLDPTAGDSIKFDVVFDEAVSGFESADVELAPSTAGGSLQADLSGGPAEYELTVTGMSSTGLVILRVPASVATSESSGLPNLASVSEDNTVRWVPMDTDAGGDAGAGGSEAVTTLAEDDSGCSCGVVGAPRSAFAPWLAIGVACVLARCRRRDQRCCGHR